MKLGDRLTILTDVADLTSQGVDRIGALEVMSHRYGARWAGHPNWRAFQERLDKQLRIGKLVLQPLLQCQQDRRQAHRERPRYFSTR